MAKNREKKVVTEQLSPEMQFLSDLKSYYPYISVTDEKLLQSIRNKDTLIGAAYLVWLNKE